MSVTAIYTHWIVGEGGLEAAIEGWNGEVTGPGESTNFFIVSFNKHIFPQEHRLTFPFLLQQPQVALLTVQKTQSCGQFLMPWLSSRFHRGLPRDSPAPPHPRTPPPTTQESCKDPWAAGLLPWPWVPVCRKPMSCQTARWAERPSLSLTV